MIVSGTLARRRLARPRVRSRRTLRCVAAVAARGAADPRGRRAHRRSCAAYGVGSSCANPTSGSPRATPPWSCSSATPRSPTSTKLAASSNRPRPGWWRRRATDRAAAEKLRGLIEAQRDVIDDPAAFGKANAEFHERLVVVGREPDARDRRRDAERDRGARGHRSEPVVLGERARSTSVAAGSARRSASWS